MATAVDAVPAALLSAASGVAVANPPDGAGCPVDTPAHVATVLAVLTVMPMTMSNLGHMATAPAVPATLFLSDASGVAGADPPDNAGCPVGTPAHVATVLAAVVLMVSYLESPANAVACLACLWLMSNLSCHCARSLIGPCATNPVG